MAGWNEIAIDNFKSAQKLRDLGYLRGCVNRAYYAAFSAVTFALGAGPAYRPGRQTPDHKLVTVLLEQHVQSLPRWQLSAVKAAVRRLYSVRIDADYPSNARIDRAIACGALRDCRVVLDGLEVLK